VLFAANRRVHGQWQSSIPSRFVDELPPEFVDMDSDQGVYAGGAGSFGSGRSLGYGGGYGSGRVRTPGRDAEATMIHADPQGFGVGDRVFHQKFGYGHVTAINDNKLAISFDKAGEKKVLDSFVVPADAV
jgi:DNA helicase-2/ATP-dependent DNA helicase PcrA